MLNIGLPYDPAAPLLGIYPKELKAGIQTSISTPVFIAALFTIFKMREQPKCPITDKWINKMRYIRRLEYFSAIKRNEILTHAKTWMNLKDIMLNEIGQILSDSTYMWSLAWQIHRDRKQSRR